jgi:hypothetical protein
MTWMLLPLAVRIKTPGWPALWLPVFLLWPFVFAVFCLALPLCVLVPAPSRAVFTLLVASYRMLCALHGTEVRVTSPEHSTWVIALY